MNSGSGNRESTDRIGSLTLESHAIPPCDFLCAREGHGDSKAQVDTQLDVSLRPVNLVNLIDRQDINRVSFGRLTHTGRTQGNCQPE